MGALAVVLITAAPVAADAYQVPAPPSPTASCDVISPVAIPCVALGKFADAVAAECRRVGVPDARCVLPLAHRVTQAARDAYLQSWVHRTARFQDALQDPVPLRETQWLGTHNSFNSLSDSFTVSHADSNQQLSLAQQLDIDVRALELDLHYLPRLEGHGAPGVTVCHGLGPKNANLGCTVEPLLATVLPQIANWLNAPGHTEEVILLYLEDQLKNASAYESVVATLDQVLRRADGTSLIYRPNPARRATNGCVPLPLDVSREEIRASGARAVLVGSCAPGWSAAVFDWSGVELESGSNSGYRPYPACDATYGRGVYAWRLVRYYEDSTLATGVGQPDPSTGQSAGAYPAEGAGDDRLRGQSVRLRSAAPRRRPHSGVVVELGTGRTACRCRSMRPAGRGWPLGRRIVRGPTPCGLSGRGRQVDRDAGTRGLRRGCPSLHSHRRGLYPAPNGQSERPSARRGRARRWRLGALPTAAMTSVVRPGRADPRIPARAQSGPR